MCVFVWKTSKASKSVCLLCGAHVPAWSTDDNCCRPRGPEFDFQSCPCHLPLLGKVRLASRALQTPTAHLHLTCDFSGADLGLCSSSLTSPCPSSDRYPGTFTLVLGSQTSPRKDETCGQSFWEDLAGSRASHPGI